MAEVSKIITDKQTDPWNGERPRQDAKKNGKTIITYRRISKRLAVDTNPFIHVLLLQPITHAHHCSKVSMPYLSLASQPFTPAGKGLVHFA